MRPPTAIRIALGIAALLAGAQARAFEDSKPPEGFVALFNGKTLDGWHGMPHFDPVRARRA